jgi:SIR2-like domain
VRFGLALAGKQSVAPGADLMAADRKEKLELIPFLKKDIWLVLGAGISRAAPSNIPLWSEMKDETIATILDVLRDHDEKKWHTPPEAFQFEKTSKNLQDSLQVPEIVMECLCDVYLEPDVKAQLATIIEAPGEPARPNECHHLITKLVSTGKVKGIITPNFDRLLEQALELAEIPYIVSMSTESAVPSTGLPIFKVHGSIDRPDTLAFLQGTYLRGMPESAIRRFHRDIRNSLIIICGYSGNDVDLFPVIKGIITAPDAGNETVVIDPFDLTHNSPYACISQNFRFVKATGAKFFAELLKKSSSPTKAHTRSPVTSLLPHKEPFECALFAADALLCARRWNLALNYFFLADDIASDAANHVGRGLATLGRALCYYAARDNQAAADEHETGRAMLSPIDLKDVRSRLGPVGEGHRISFWLMRVKHACSLAALAVSLRERDNTVKRKLLRIAKFNSLCFEWGDQPVSRIEQTGKCLQIRAKAVNRLITAYESYLDNCPSYREMLDDCMELCRSGGCGIELVACGYLLNTLGKEEPKDFAVDIAIDDKVIEDVLSLFSHPGDPFKLEDKVWHWK